MSFFSAIKDKVAKKLLGDLITDLGTIAIDEIYRKVSVSIWRRGGQPPDVRVKLVFKGAWTIGKGETHYTSIECSQEWADYLEMVAREMRKQINAPPT